MRDPKHPRQFAEEFRRQIVALVDSGKPRVDALREHDLGKSSVRLGVGRRGRGPSDPVGEARRVDADLARDLRVGGSPLVVHLHGAPLELRRVLRARFSHDPPPFPRNGNGAETGLDLSTDSGQTQIHVEGSDLILEEPVEDGQLFAFTTCSYQTRNSRTTVFAVWGYNAH